MRNLFSLACRVLAAATILICCPIASGQLRVNLGIYGGQVQDIAAYDNGAATEVLAAVRSQNAVYRKGTAGWDVVFEEGTEGQEVEADLTPGYEDIVWAIVNNQLHTHDPGDPWNRSGWTARTVGADPQTLCAHSSGMYVGAGGSVYRSTDGGASFQSLATYPTTGRIMSIAVYDANTVYVVVGDVGHAVLYASTDAGTGFASANVSVTYLGSAIEDFEVVGIDADDPLNAASATRFYVGGNSAEANVYRTEDGGAAWTRLPFTADDGYPQYIEFADHVGGRRMFIAATYSDDFGDSWTPIDELTSTTSLGTISTNPNDGAIAFDPNDPAIVYIATDWALGQWNMNTLAASEVFNAEGFEAVLINDIAQVQTNATTKATIWIAAKSGLGKTTTHPATSSASDWLFPIYPAGDGAPITAVAIDPDDIDTVLAGNSGGAIYRTNIGGGGAGLWTLAHSSLLPPFDAHFTTPERVRITDIGFVPGDSSIAYASAAMTEGAYEGAVYWSVTGGAVWSFDFTTAGGTDLNVPVNALMVMDNAVWAGVGHPDAPAGASRGLYARLAVTLDDDWWKFPSGTTMDDETVYALGGTRTGSVFTVYAATEGGVYRGDLDSAVTSAWTWTAVTPNGRQTYVAVTANPQDADEVYAAHDNYIWGSADGGATWSLVPPSGTTLHEQVFVLAYDDLLVGTANGLFAPTEEALSAVDGRQDDEPEEGGGEIDPDHAGTDGSTGAEPGDDDDTHDPDDDSTGSSGEADTDGGTNVDGATGGSESSSGNSSPCGIGTIAALVVCVPALRFLRPKRYRFR